MSQNYSYWCHINGTPLLYQYPFILLIIKIVVQMYFIGHPRSFIEFYNFSVVYCNVILTMQRNKTSSFSHWFTVPNPPHVVASIQAWNYRWREFPIPLIIESLWVSRKEIPHQCKAREFGLRDWKAFALKEKRLLLSSVILLQVKHNLVINSWYIFQYKK